MDKEYMTLDIRAVLALIRRNIILLVALTVIGAAAAYCYTDYVIDPMYESSVMLIVNLRDEQATVISSGELSSARELIRTYAVILTNDALLEEVISQLNLSTGVSSLKGRISASEVNQSQVMRMTVRDTDPATALVVLEFIVDRAPELLINTVKAGSVEIVSPPKANYSPVSPSIRRNTAIGALAGLLIAAAFVIIKKALENTFLSEEDIGRYLGLPVLGVIPAVKHLQRNNGHNGGKSTALES